MGTRWEQWPGGGWRMTSLFPLFWANNSYEQMHVDKQPCMHTHKHTQTVHIHRVERAMCTIMSSYLCFLARPVVHSNAVCVPWLPASPTDKKWSIRPTNHNQSCLHWYFVPVLHDELGAVATVDYIVLINCLCCRWSNLRFFFFLRWIKQEECLTFWDLWSLCLHLNATLLSTAFFPKNAFQMPLLHTQASSLQHTVWYSGLFWSCYEPNIYSQLALFSTAMESHVAWEQAGGHPSPGAAGASTKTYYFYALT